MSRETLKDFLAAKGHASDSISYGSLSDENSSGAVDTGDDLGVDSGTGEELIQLSTNDKGLLGDYVNYIATNYRGGNKYKIAPGNKKANDINRGTSIQASEISNDSDVFVKQATTLGETLSQYSNSGKFESSESGLSKIIDKTSFNKELDGNTLLGISGDDIDTTGSPNPGNDSDDHRFVKQMTSEMLQRNSRFSPGQHGKQYSDSRLEDASEVDNKKFAKSQNSFGVNKNDGDDFISGQLKSVGASLLLKAAGIDIETMNPDDIDASVTQTKQKMSITSREVQAATAYNSPVDRDSRGAFDLAESRTVNTTHTVPGAEFGSLNTEIDSDTNALNDNILKEFVNILKNYLIDNEEITRDNKSVYTFNGYINSATRFIKVTIENENISNKDKAYFATMSRSLLRLPTGLKRDEKIKKILDVFAVLGDVDLTLYNEKGNENKLIWDVDKLKDGPATRVSKSRSSDGFTTKSLAWRTSSMPSMYHMPMSILRSVQKMGNISKKNPVKAMLGSSIGDKTYLAQNLEEDAFNTLIGNAESDKTRTKIPKSMVNIYEDRLDAEYVPFYFHDLRTNEIVAFHAFLTSLNDSFTANYTEYEGYGRMDSVQIYKNTNRTISGKFKLIATSKEDFDEMWFKINKLVEMLYPQWTSGELMNAGINDSDTKFIKPFSQIPSISPMIRLRIGDVIRGNYSRFNLGRLFGSGHVETYVNRETVTPTTIGAALEGLTGDTVNSVLDKVSDIALQVFMAAFGSPLQFIDVIPGDKAVLQALKNQAFALLSHNLKNGFVNPLTLYGLNKLKDPDLSPDSSAPGAGLNGSKFSYGPKPGDVVLLKPSNGKVRYTSKGDEGFIDWGIFSKISAWKGQENNSPSEVNIDDETFDKVFNDRFLKCRILGSKYNENLNRTLYNIVVIDTQAGNILSKRVIVVTHDDIIVDPDWMFDNYFAYFLDPVNALLDKVQDIVDTAASEMGILGDSIDLYTTSFEDFMHPSNNSITKAFEESAGRGLAGFIGKLSYDLIGENINWETAHGSRAPMMLEISFDFKPVHDIAPGLDSDGFSRAPVYNVGSILNNMSGDQQGEALGSKNRYNKAAADAVKSNKG